MTVKHQQNITWTGVYVGTFLSVLMYMLLEWLFIITKPNFGNTFGNLSRKTEILLFSTAFVTCLSFLLLLPLCVSSFLPGLCRYRRWLLTVGSFIPIIIFASMLFLGIDNFTYTVFKFGVATSENIGRGVYSLVLILLVISRSRWVTGKLAVLSAYLDHLPARSLVMPGLITILSIALGWPFLIHQSEVEIQSPIMLEKAAPYPNIVLITMDGVNATNLSLYGYERDTTPNLRRLSSSSLVAENAFPNSGNTAGAVISLLTGKYPAKTGVLFPPDILRHKDAYQHLPGILHSLGYHTAQFSYPYYADAYTLNLQNGFDRANGRMLPTQGSLFSSFLLHLPTEYAYFLFDAGTHIIDRFLHIFYVREMLNPYDIIIEPATRSRDDKRVSDFIEFLDQVSQPVFVHIHFMHTHGTKFFPQQQVFSQGKDLLLQADWDEDIYDDSILEVDRHLGIVVQALTARGVLDQTILIVGADHGQRFTTINRTPLLFRFPHGEHARHIQANTQNLDIVPTILDYLKIKQPAWVQGESLLTNEVRQRPIFGVSPYAAEFVAIRWATLNAEKLKPPFYQFGKISLVYCSRWYQLDLYTHQWDESKVRGSTTRCPADLSKDEALALMRTHLQENGFDVSTLTP